MDKNIEKLDNKVDKAKKQVKKTPTFVDVSQYAQEHGISYREAKKKLLGDLK